jgi:hypothetical protein
MVAGSSSSQASSASVSLLLPFRHSQPLLPPRVVLERVEWREERRRRELSTFMSVLLSGEEAGEGTASICR